ncbi:MAG: YeeE/YedE thiosulfate transporter family protein [bacterium]|nr:YeeE/YedE thiosulfate transporter family protein [bacterium]
MSNKEITAQPYWPNLLAGIGLGLVLLMAYYIAGRGLGGSGAVTRVGAGLLNLVAPEHTGGLEYFSRYIREGKVSLNDWLVFQTIGVFFGGFVAAMTAGRFGKTIEHGPQITAKQRLGWALLGGIIMGIGARIARGCTSGQALSGGATMALGSWVFMLMLFAGGFLAAIFFKRLWL